MNYLFDNISKLIAFQVRLSTHCVNGSRISEFHFILSLRFEQICNEINLI